MIGVNCILYVVFVTFSENFSVLWNYHCRWWAANLFLGAYRHPLGSKGSSACHALPSEDPRRRIHACFFLGGGVGGLTVELSLPDLMTYVCCVVCHALLHVVPNMPAERCRQSIWNYLCRNNICLSKHDLFYSVVN